MWQGAKLCWLENQKENFVFLITLSSLKLVNGIGLSKRGGYP